MRGGGGGAQRPCSGEARGGRSVASDADADLRAELMTRVAAGPCVRAAASSPVGGSHAAAEHAAHSMQVTTRPAAGALPCDGTVHVLMLHARQRAAWTTSTVCSPACIQQSAAGVVLTLMLTTTAPDAHWQVWCMHVGV